MEPARTDCPLLDFFQSEDLIIFLGRSLAEYCGIPDFCRFSSTCTTLSKVLRTQSVTELIQQDAGAPSELETLEEIAFWQALEKKESFRNEHRVGFDFASTEVSNRDIANSKARVRDAKQLMKQFPRVHVILEAHCGTSGPHHIAAQFSHARGASVALALIIDTAEEDEDDNESQHFEYGRMALNAVFDQNDPFYHYYETSSSEDEDDDEDMDQESSSSASSEPEQNVQYMALESSDLDVEAVEVEVVNGEPSSSSGDAAQIEEDHEPAAAAPEQNHHHQQTIRINAWGRRISDRIVQTTFRGGENDPSYALDKFANLAMSGKGWVEIYFSFKNKNGGGQEFPIGARPMAHYDAPDLEPFDTFVVA
jgi:hypothetical protein